MKKFIYIVSLALAGTLAVSCDDFLEVESNSVTPAESHNIDTEASARYAMFGILSQMQEVADRYVVLGELRGDLLTVTENSTPDLRSISNFEADSLNAYHMESELYSIINNCNYLISRIDTAVIVTNTLGDREKVLKREMAQATAIRAWSYLQLALAYGSVSYYTEPILSVDQKVSTQELDLDALAPMLISELLQWVPADDETPEQVPSYGTLGNYSSAKMFIPVRLILGDLYLLTNQYEPAAKMYFAHLLSNKLSVLNRRNGWSDNTYTRVSPNNWTGLFSTDTELQSLIHGSESYLNGQQHLAEMFDVKEDYLMAPSSAVLNLWQSQVYAYGASVSTLGDLRGAYGSYTMTTRVQGEAELEAASVSKYKNLNQTVLLYRTSTVYLRYAEAINRLGKYNMAFALLKYGLNRETFSSATRIPGYEWQDAEGNPIDYLDFGQSNLNNNEVFASNVGMHSRGCGENIDKFNSYCIESGVDSLVFVENLLLDEMALETAFEGSRFTDILRISRHRESPDFVADRIARRSSSLNAALHSRLLDQRNWYLPRKSRK